jgi:putative mycofactocin binding protein MftB
VSTEPHDRPSRAAEAFDPSGPYRLSPNVALRDESFGALAYHFGNRKLSFLKSPRLVELVRDLERHPSARDAVGRLPEPERERYLRALAGLAHSDMIVPVPQV